MEPLDAYGELEGLDFGFVPNEDSRENWQQTFATNPESKKLPLAVVPAHFRRATHVLLATIALHSDYS